MRDEILKEAEELIALLNWESLIKLYEELPLLNKVRDLVFNRLLALDEDKFDLYLENNY